MPESISYNNIWMGLIESTIQIILDKFLKIIRAVYSA